MSIFKQDCFTRFIIKKSFHKDKTFLLADSLRSILFKCQRHITGRERETALGDADE